MELEILGSGTSHGVPVIGCSCAVCSSADSKDNRLRSSALIRGDDGEAILIDCGPEFRIQALRARITRLDAVLITHAHADHLHGIDDIRIFSHHNDMPIYVNDWTIEDIRNRFDYVFKPTQEGGGKPKLDLRVVQTEPEGAMIGKQGVSVRVGEITITPIPIRHGILPILGWRIGDTAYLTDCSEIPESSWPLLAGTRNLVIGALRVRPHSTHLNFDQAIAVIRRLDVERAWFTHLCHDFTHEGIRAWLAENAPDKKIEPAFDGLRITIR